MPNINISRTIVDICKKYDIPYESCNPKFEYFESDARTLADIYIELKEIMVKLKDIEDRHELGLHNIFENILKTIDTADHSVIKLAHKLKNKDVAKE
jgi:hypothetical protein